MHSGAVLVLDDKVTPRVADGRSVPMGDADRGERRQKNAVPQSQKCLGSEVRKASALA